MRLHTLALLSLLTCAASAAASAAAMADAAREPGSRLLVRWRDEASQEAFERVSAQSGQTLRRGPRISRHIEVLQLDATRSPAQLDAVLAELRNDPAVAWAVQDRRVRAHAYTPNDPLFAQQWYLQDQQISAIRASRAWDVARGGALGSGVVVAVLDSGVRFDHPDLARAAAGGKLLPGYDFVSADKANVYLTANDGNGWDNDPSDPGDYLTAADLQTETFKTRKCGGGANEDQPVSSSWHGTRVAGMIGAGTDNTTGIAGTGFNARVLPVRVLGRCGGYDSDVLAGMYWAAGLSIPTSLLSGTPPANPTPARIINMSLGGEGACTAAYAEAVREITAAGTLVVASAGNDGTASDSPANCAGSVSVAGVRHIGTKVGFSNLGADVAISAPGGNCVLIGAGDPCLFSLDTTTDSGLRGPVGPTYTNQYDANVGTSFAAPLVAASAALMLSVNPALTPAALLRRLQASAMPFPTSSTTEPAPPVCKAPADATEPQVSECICTTSTCGAGLLDAAAAVQQALRPAAVAGYRGTVAAGRELTLDGTASGAAVGRSLASFQWSVVATSGGANTPAFANPNAATTTVSSPTLGSYTLRLTVTDDQGATDTAEITVEAATSGGGVTPTNPPPANTGGGGGALGAAGLLLAALAFLKLKQTPGGRRS